MVLAYGVLCGVDTATVCTAATAAVARWFKERRGLATGIVFVGSSIGGVLHPLVVSRAVEHLGWGRSIRIIASVSAVLGVALATVR